MKKCRMIKEVQRREEMPRELVDRGREQRPDERVRQGETKERWGGGEEMEKEVHGGREDKKENRER